MKRIDAYGATTENEFTEGSPVTGVPPTRVSADWLNVIQEEVATVIESAGLTLDQGTSYPAHDTTQLYQAIQSIVTSLAATLLAELPVGTITAFAGPVANIPSGWLHCDGSELVAVEYPELFAALGNAWGGGGSTFNIPDLRGRFMRGTDLTAGNDPDAGARTASATGGNTGNAVGTVQADAYKSHQHTYSIPLGDNNNDNTSPPAASNGSLQGVNYNGTTALTGGSETRPKNVAVTYIIRRGLYVPGT